MNRIELMAYLQYRIYQLSFLKQYCLVTQLPSQLYQDLNVLYNNQCLVQMLLILLEPLLRLYTLLDQRQIYHEQHHFAPIQLQEFQRIHVLASHSYLLHHLLIALKVSFLYSEFSLYSHLIFLNQRLLKRNLYGTLPSLQYF